MRSTIIAVVVASAAGCAGQADSSDGLDPGGAPEILQVLVRERVTVTDDEGAEVVELQSRLAFGDHDDIDRDADDREVIAAVARDGQRVRVVFDELLRGNTLEEVPCADGTWSRVPLGTDFDDVALCAGPDLSRCVGLCIGADGPIGILDDNGDGAFDDTRLIEGVALLRCDDVDVPLDPQRSYFQPSGSQLLSAGSVGTDSLGPAVVLAPAEGMRPGAHCGVRFSDQVVDKQGTPIPDTADIGFDVEAFTVAGSEPASGATAVALTGEDSTDAVISVLLNAALAPDTIATAVTVTAGGAPIDGAVFAVSPDDAATVTVTVPGGFAPSTTYVVTVTGGDAGVRDIFDDVLAADATITWTTEAP